MIVDSGIAVGALGAVGASAVGKLLSHVPAVRSMRMSGLSIAAPDAAPWVTDFLNAAYYERPVGGRDIDDLRLAYAILATLWHRRGDRRLRATDLVEMHEAFGGRRFSADGGSARGVLSRAQLVAGGNALHGAWFEGAYGDAARRGWGLVFETVAARDAYRPEARLERGALRTLTPPRAADRQTWHTYDAVEVADAGAFLAGLGQPETWPDYASALGRFIPVRRGGLRGQTFEIEVVATLVPKAPLFTRGYVTVTRLVDTSTPQELRLFVDDLNGHLLASGRGEPQAVPAGAVPLLGLDLTTHAGHFLGRAISKLVVYQDDVRAYIREAAVWDPMPWHLRLAYWTAGARAQRAFWGMGTADESMLHQMVLRTADLPYSRPPSRDRR